LYKKNILEKLNNIIPILQKISMGDFSEKIEIPEAEDEFTELLVAIKLMAEDLEKASKKANSKIEEVQEINKVMVNREMKMIELKQKITELEKQLAEK